MLLKGPFSMGKHLGFSFLSVAEKKLLKNTADADLWVFKQSLFLE
jgi:hypothetical protein